MNEQPSHSVRVQFICRSGHEHTLCVRVRRGVPAILRCEEPPGYGPSGGGCPTPPDLLERVERELQDHLERWRRLGFVTIHAN